MQHQIDESTTATIEFWQAGEHAGHCICYYRDTDGGSGYGEQPEVSYWYGTRDQCQARIDSRKVPAPRLFHPIELR